MSATALKLCNVCQQGKNTALSTDAGKEVGYTTPAEMSYLPGIADDEFRQRILNWHIGVHALIE